VFYKYTRLMSLCLYSKIQFCLGSNHAFLYYQHVQDYLLLLFFYFLSMEFFCCNHGFHLYDLHIHVYYIYYYYYFLSPKFFFSFQSIIFMFIFQQCFLILLLCFILCFFFFFFNFCHSFYRAINYSIFHLFSLFFMAIATFWHSPSISFSFFIFLNDSSTFCIFHVMFVHFISIEARYVYLLLLWLIWFSIISLLNPNYHYEKIISVATCLFSYNLIVLNIF
jgi:hypothetical protein